MFLDKKDINLLDTVKQCSYSELDLLAVEMRERIIDVVSKNGGHLASNLGSVELTIALHRVFDSPRDKIVFDVGHQTYAHKILTGRNDEFDSLRQLDGLSGFPKISESNHDMFDSGHSSTSISAAYGYAVSRDLNGDDYSCVAVIGDGALTGGVAYEALDMAGSTNTPLIVVVNDNQMSIDGSKGSISSHLNDLRTSSEYINFKQNLKDHLDSLPTVYKVLKGTRDIVKNAIIPSGIFEELGFKYFGPIDGHDIREMSETLDIARRLNRPVLVHVITKKGKGFVPAEKNPSKFHGIGSFDPDTVSSNSAPDPKSYSEIFGNKLANLAIKDEKICAISAAMLCATGLEKMYKLFPERVFDVGIAEQHAVSFAAGLALNGMKPVVAIYSTFLQRAYDQIVTEVAMQNLPVIFAIDRAGITGRDGETHQGMFDISFLNSIPNMTLLSPKDGKELESMLEYALTLNSPCAIRYPRGKNKDLSAFSLYSKVSEAELCTADGEYAILALGSMVEEALECRDILAELGMNVAVYNVRRVKPLQNTFLEIISKKYKKILTVEDGCLNGGFGQAVSSFYSANKTDTKVYNLAWPDKFIEHGSVEELRKRYGLDAMGIAKASRDFFRE